MRVLIVGSDGHGSFKVRGRQLGDAIGARVTTHPNAQDWVWADVVVLVKHAATVWGIHAKRSKKPIVWDVLDIWRQPEDNQLAVERIRQKVFDVRDVVGIKTLIGATRAMADQLGGVYLPHHSRPGLAPAPVRDGAITVAYEGQAKYLGSWRGALEDACAALGMTFVVNPPDIREADVVVAFRGERWDGDVCRQWKSGVKVVNAVVAGRPILGQSCAAWTEIIPTGAAMTGPDACLKNGLRLVSDAKFRRIAYEDGLARAEEFSLPAIARTYRVILESAVAA
jgi:hypothetical protein